MIFSVAFTAQEVEIRKVLSKVDFIGGLGPLVVGQNKISSVEFVDRNAGYRLSNRQQSWE